MTLKVTCDCKANFQAINYGLRDSLGPMPLHQLCQTITATINNNTVSCNIKDVIDPMLRMLDNRDLARYNNSTPVMYDTYANYPDMAGANNSNFGGFDLATDQFIKPRGAFALDAVAADAGFNVDTPLFLEPPIGLTVNGFMLTFDSNSTGLIIFLLSQGTLLVELCNICRSVFSS